MNYHKNRSPEEVLNAISIVQNFLDINQDEMACFECKTAMNCIEDWVVEDVQKIAGPIVESKTEV